MGHTGKLIKDPPAGPTFQPFNQFFMDLIVHNSRMQNPKSHVKKFLYYFEANINP